VAVTSGRTLPSQISVERAGGFAGVQDTVVVGPDGAWTRTDRAGGHVGGQLGPEEIAGLGALVSDPRLADEAGRPETPTKCSDAFHYVLTVGTERISYVDCPGDAGRPEAGAAVVTRVMQLTSARA
jgi:hypothetical protein